MGRIVPLVSGDSGVVQVQQCSEPLAELLVAELELRSAGLLAVLQPEGDFGQGEVAELCTEVKLAEGLLLQWFLILGPRQV